MRKFMSLVIFLSLSLVFVSWLTREAGAAPSYQAVFVIGQQGYTIDGEAKNMEGASPFIENDRTYIPVRFLAYALGVPESGVKWEQNTQTVVLTIAGEQTVSVKLQVGNTILTTVKSAGPGTSGKPGSETPMYVTPLLRDDRVYLPARFVANAFGYEVAWNQASQAVLVGPPGNLPQPPAATAKDTSPAAAGKDTSWTVRYEQKDVATSVGNKSANLIYVNMNNPSVEIRPVSADDRVGRAEDLASMAARVNATAAINGSFFNAYDSNDLLPQGTVEINYRYCHLGSNATLGIDENNRAIIKKLTPYVEGSTNGSWSFPNWWYAWGINHPSADGIVIFTPEYRDPVTPSSNKAIVVKNGVITAIAAGQIEIPAGGYVICYGSNNFERSEQFSIGKTIDYRVVYKENEGLRFKAALSNDPMLLVNGVAAVGDVSEPKLTIGAPRSFVGVTGDNTLVMGTVDSANVWELAEVAKNLGLKDALNLDGGASCGLYYNGGYISQPGRQLSNCLAVIQH